MSNPITELNVRIILNWLESAFEKCDRMLLTRELTFTQYSQTLQYLYSMQRYWEEVYENVTQ